MKLSCTADEIESYEGMSDADLAKVMRAAVADFRKGRTGNDNELEPGAQTTRGATGGPREGAAVRAAQDSALKRHEENVRQAERDKEVTQFIKGYDRL